VSGSGYEAVAGFAAGRGEGEKGVDGGLWGVWGWWDNVCIYNVLFGGGRPALFMVLRALVAGGFEWNIFKLFSRMAGCVTDVRVIMISVTNKVLTTS
jgi:hypothetical protein